MAATADRHRHPLAVRGAEDRPRRPCVEPSTRFYIPPVLIRRPGAEDRPRRPCVEPSPRFYIPPVSIRRPGAEDRPRRLDDGKGFAVFVIMSPAVDSAFYDSLVTELAAELSHTANITGSTYEGFDFKDCGLTDKEEYSCAMHSLDEPDSITAPEIMRIPKSGYEQLVEPMIALGIGFEGPSTPAAESSSVHTVPNIVLLLDSGAGCHMVSHAALLRNPRDPPAGKDHVRTADGSRLPVVGYGDIQMEGFDIPDVLAVLGLEYNVISVGQLASSHKIGSLFFGDQCNLMLPDGSLIGGAFRRNDNQYILRFLEIP